MEISRTGDYLIDEAGHKVYAPVGFDGRIGDLHGQLVARRNQVATLYTTAHGAAEAASGRKDFLAAALAYYDAEIDSAKVTIADRKLAHRLAVAYFGNSAGSNIKLENWIPVAQAAKRHFARVDAAQ